MCDAGCKAVFTHKNVHIIKEEKYLNWNKGKSYWIVESCLVKQK